MQLLLNFPVNKWINTYLHSKQEKNWANMTSCNQLKNYFFLLLFYIKIAYFVRERIALFTGIYISMKSTIPFKPESSEKIVRTSKFISQKQNKTKKKKIDVKQ